MAADFLSPTRPGLFKKYTIFDVPPELWAAVEARPLAEAVRSSGARFETAMRVIVPFLNRDYAVDFNSQLVYEPADNQPTDFKTGQVLLSYLAMAQDFGPAGRQVSYRELRGGELFFYGPHALPAKPLTDRFGADPDGFQVRAGRIGLGPWPEAGSGVAVIGRVLPHLTLGLILNPAEEEFPAELVYTFDAYAHYHLPLVGLLALAYVLVSKLTSD